MTEALDRALDRGRKGLKGGVILLESNTTDAIAEAYAKGTGRSLAEARRDLALTEGNPDYAKQQGILLTEDHVIGGFYDRRTGKTFLVLPNLSEREAPAILMHELGGHANQFAALDKWAKRAVMQPGRQPEKTQAFLDRVLHKLKASGALDAETDTEYAPYMIQAGFEEGMKAGHRWADGRFFAWADKALGKPVGDFLRRAVNAIQKMWLERGFIHTPGRMKIEDVLTWATLSLERASRGDVKTRDARMDEAQADIQASKSPRVRRTVAELLDAVEQMKSWTDWYDRHKAVLGRIFGEEAGLFQEILSATSQRADVKTNVSLALKAYRQLR